MAVHTELRPDDASLPLLLADAALHQSNANVTRISGILSVDNGDGSETWIGGNVNSDSNGGVTKWIGDTTVPGKPTGLSAVSTVNCVLVSWNGTLHGGVPADFDHISVFVVEGGTVESLGDLNCAGTILSKKYAEGTILEVYAVAYDAARDEQGRHRPNMSEESDRITLVVERDVDMEQLNNAAADMEQKADDAIAKADEAIAKGDKVRSDLQAEVGKVKANVADVDAKAEQAKTSAEAAASKANSDKAELDKSVAALDKRMSDVSAKGDKMAGQITDITGTVNGQQTKLNEFGTKLDGAITRNDTTVKSVTELKQTVTGLSSTVSQTTKTASDALSKATSVEQTANGLKATLSKDYQTTKQADGKYSTKTELSATSESLSAGITSVKKTADGAVTSANAAQATADGVKATLSRDYTSTKNADLKYSTKAELSATSDSLSSSISSVRGTADGAVATASKAQQTADAVTLNLSKNYQTKAQNDAAYATKTSLKATSDSLSANITANAKTAQGAVDKATSLEANLNGFKTTVSQTYGHGSNLWVNPTFDSDKPQIAARVDNVTAPNGSGVNLLAYRDHFNSTTSFPVVPGHTYVITAHIKRIKGNIPLNAGIWYTAQTSGTSWDDLPVPESTSDLSDGWIAATWRTRCPNGKSRGCVCFHIEQWDSSYQFYISNVVCVDVTGLQPAGDYATNSSLTQTANSIRAQVSEVAKTASGAMGKASSVEQTASGLSTKITEQAKTLDATVKTANEAKSTADSNKRTISQVASTADGAVSRVSSLEQNLNGFKTSVAKTYQTKGDYPTKAEVQSRIDQSASSIKSTVGQTYTPLSDTDALRKGATRTFTLAGAAGKAKWVRLGYLTSNGDSSSVLLHVYSGDGYNGMARQNAEFEIFVKDGWQQSASATSAFGVSVSRIRNADDVKVKVMAFSSCTCDIWAYLPWSWWNGHYTLQGDYKAWQDGPNCGGERILDSEPTNGTAQDLAYEALSTRSYVDQTSRSVALGVVQNYKGADGSGLATKSDITVAKNSITSTVAGTYATKSGVTQEISSKITQNNNSLDVKFATKTETKTAQATANTAKSDASDAQSRVGVLEDCIRLTSEGVRAGHQKNGVFNGVSALVNTDGSFDLLDKDGNLLTRIDRHSLQVAGDDGVGSGHLILSQDGLDITVQPTANKTATYHIRLGAGGISITAPDGSHINCSARTGLDLETVKYGKLSIGPGGLQFTNDQGWGLGLSAAGWSMKWAGNHTLATGPTAGALYIDGHEIVTR